MRGAYCYLPILRTRGGAFRALASVSHLARSRIVPLFDVPIPVLRDGKTLEKYLAERVSGIITAWGRARPVYVDVHDLPLDLRTSSGSTPIAFLFDLLRSEGVAAIPVTGTVSERNRDYLITVEKIIARDKRGACLRLTEDDFTNSQTLRASVIEAIGLLEISPAALDIVFDFRYVGKRSIDELRATVLDAFEAIYSVGAFRNIVVTGSSVPDVLGKKDHGKVRRESRIEFDLWTQLVRVLANRATVVFSDYGVVAAHYVPPDKPVRAPARIRYTTEQGHVFYRTNRKEYLEICKQLVSSTDFVGETFSAGDQRISQCTKGISSAGGPAEWVACDMNHHLEFVSEQVWRYLNESRFIDQFALPEPEKIPWLQVNLV